MATTERTRLDPVTFSILSSAFVALVDEMVSTVQRSCLSFSIYVGDFSGGLMDADGDLVAEGTRDISVHVGALQPSTKAILEDFPEDEMKPGDVFMFNDPYRGGTHLPDMSFIRPIFWDGKRIGFTCQKGHWLDVGGSIPGSMDALATEIYQEGQDIVPAKIVEEGVPRHDVVNNLLSNIRVPVESAGDMWAQIEATKTGERRLFEMIGKYGLDLVLAAMQGTMDHTERQVIAEVLMCPEGTWEAEDFIDGDPNAPEKGPIRVHAKLTITHNPPKLIYDVRGSGPADQLRHELHQELVFRCHRRWHEAYIPLDTPQRRMVEGRRGHISEGERTERVTALRRLRRGCRYLRKAGQLRVRDLGAHQAGEVLGCIFQLRLLSVRRPRRPARAREVLHPLPLGHWRVWRHARTGRPKRRHTDLRRPDCKTSP